MPGPITVDSLAAEWFIRPGDVVFDIGAFHGGNSALYLARGASAVYAFEPFAESRERIPDAVRAHPAFRLKPYALSDRTGTGELIVPRNHHGGSTLLQSFYDVYFQSTGNTAEVHGIEVRTLDELELPRAHFWKLDVEGSELAVLRGAARTLEHSLPDIIQLELFTIDKQHYLDTLNLLARHFAHLWAIGMTEELRPIHHKVTRQTIARPQFHRDLRRAGTPHYFASWRSCPEWIRLAKQAAAGDGGVAGPG